MNRRDWAGVNRTLTQVLKIAIPSDDVHAVRDIVEEASRKARGVLERNRALLEEGSRLLLEKEILSESDLEQLFGKGIGPPGPVAEESDAGTGSSA